MSIKQDDTIFQQLDLGTGSPTSIPMETIKVKIMEGALIQNFAKAFVNEGYRKAPLKAKQVALTSDEMVSYCNYLLWQRVKAVNNDCPDWRKLKLLWIPSFVQYVMSTVGIFVNRQYGLTVVPDADAPQINGADMTFENALVISEKIAAFESDLQMVKDAMPRGVDGDPDVMSTALIANCIRSMRVVGHVSATYVVAFLNLKLEQESLFKALYRVQYDDLSFIASALTSEKIV